MDLTLFDVPATGKKRTMPYASTREKLKVDRELARRRYYLHRQIQDLFNIEVNGAKRTINIAPYKTFADIPVGYRFYVGQLMKMGYNIQFEIL